MRLSNATDHRSGFLPAVAIGHEQEIGGHTFTTLSTSPAVFRIRDFVSRAEAEHLAQLANQASISDDHSWSRTADGKQSGIRTSRSAWVGQHFGLGYGAPESAVTQALMARAAAIVGANASHAEGIQVVRYTPRSQFRHHEDAYEPWQSEAEYGGKNRFATILVYLNDAHTALAGSEMLISGGETHFPMADGMARPRAEAPPPRPPDGSEEPVDCHAHGLTVEPRAFDALLFYNLLPGGEPGKFGGKDHATLHAGCAVVEGFKWAANIWLWDGPPPRRKLRYTLKRPDGTVVHVEAAGVEEARALAGDLTS